MTAGEHTIIYHFNYAGKKYLATIYHILEMTAEEIHHYCMTEETFLVFLDREDGDEKVFELFINAGDTHWSVKSDLIDHNIVEILGNEIDHRSK